MRAAQYDRLVQSGELERAVVPVPPAVVIRRGAVVGTLGVSLGVGLFALIVYAVLR